MPVTSSDCRLSMMDMAYGYTLTGREDESRRALDVAFGWLSQPIREDDTILGMSIIPNSDLITLYQTTNEIYFGYGSRVIPMLQPCSESLVEITLRGATVTQAKLARAYANAGDPDMAWGALDAIEQVDSQLARTELRRAVPVLNRWHGRSDVRDVMHQLQAQWSTAIARH